MSEYTPPSPETHVFVGMFRPPFSEACAIEHSTPRNGGSVRYGDALNYHCLAAIGGDKHRELWLLGRYDTPVYKTIEEVVAMKEGRPNE